MTNASNSMKTTFNPLLLLGLAAMPLVGAGSAANASVTNYHCSDAIIIATYQYSNSQSTAGTTSASDVMPSCVRAFGNAVWYNFRPDVNGQLVTDTITAAISIPVSPFIWVYVILLVSASGKGSVLTI